MKRTKIFALLLCFALILCVVPMSVSADDAYNVVPAMVDASAGFDIFEGAAFSGTFGSSAITGQGHMPGYSPAQKTFAAGSVADYGWFEFDFYLDDVSILTARNTKLYLNLRSGSGSGTSRGLFEYQDQITANGWNHIIVRTGLADDILEILTMARFYIDIDAGDTGATDRYRIANICATEDLYGVVPAMVDASAGSDIFEGAAFSGTFGSSAITGQGHMPGYSPAQKTFTAGSVADYGWFEFDFYLDDVSIITARNTKLYLNLRSGSGSGTSRGIFEYQDQITANGWNHIIVKTGLADDILEILTMARFYIDIDAGSTGASDRYRIANICATEDLYGVVPAMVDASPRFDIFEGAAVQCVLGSEQKTGQAHLPGYNSTTPAQKTFTNTGLGDMGYDVYEFDFYVDDVTVIAARNVRLYFNLRTSGNVHKATFEFQNQITASGWNHIKIITNLSSSVLNEIGMTRFFIDMDAGSAGAADRLRAANICSTKDAYNLVPATVAVTPKMDIFEGAAFSGTFGSSAITGQGHMPGYSPAQKTFSAGSVADYGWFEFDFYLDDVSILTARNTKLYLNLRSGSGSGTSRGIFEYQDQITANGWNHILVKTDLADDILEILTMARFYIDIDAGSTGASDRYRIANICAIKESPFKTRSLVLTDSIGLNFFMDLSKLTAEEKANSYMTFAVTNSEMELRADYNGSFMNAEGTYYGFTCQLSSVQLAETVTPTLHYGDGETVTGAPYSVKDYIDYVVAHSGSFDSTVVDLVKSLGDYGHYMQIYLGNKNVWTTGEKYTVLEKYRASDYTSAQHTAYLNELNSSNVAMTKDITGSAVTAVTYNLNFDSTTHINVKLATDEQITASAVVDGVTLNTSGSGQVQLRTQGLPILRLGDAFTVSGSGTENTTPFTVTLSGLSYIRATLNKVSESIEGAKDAVSALYGYYRAACVYQTMVTGGNNGSLNGETVEE